VGWIFPWLFSYDTDFSGDLHIMLEGVQGSVECHYANATQLWNDCKMWSEDDELRGLSVFLREGWPIRLSSALWQILVAMNRVCDIG